MKSILPLLLILSLIAINCTKPDDHQDITGNLQYADTGQYIVFTLQGDSFNNEKFVMNDSILQSVGNFNGNRKIIGFLSPAGNGFSISAYFYFDKKVAGIPITLDTISNSSTFIMTSPYKGYYYIRSITGKLTITQYPDSINDYCKGSFSGSYFDQHSKRILQVTEGRFRIKRSE